METDSRISQHNHNKHRQVLNSLTKAITTNVTEHRQSLSLLRRERFPSFENILRDHYGDDWVALLESTPIKELRDLMFQLIPEHVGVLEVKLTSEELREYEDLAVQQALFVAAWLDARNPPIAYAWVIDALREIVADSIAPSIDAPPGWKPSHPYRFTWSLLEEPVEIGTFYRYENLGQRYNQCIVEVLSDFGAPRVRFLGDGLERYVLRSDLTPYTKPDKVCGGGGGDPMPPRAPVELLASFSPSQREVLNRLRPGPEPMKGASVADLETLRRAGWIQFRHVSSTTIYCLTQAATELVPFMDEEKPQPKGGVPLGRVVEAYGYTPNNLMSAPPKAPRPKVEPADAPRVTRRARLWRLVVRVAQAVANEVSNG